MLARIWDGPLAGQEVTVGDPPPVTLKLVVPPRDMAKLEPDALPNAADFEVELYWIYWPEDWQRNQAGPIYLHEPVQWRGTLAGFDLPPVQQITQLLLARWVPRKGWLTTRRGISHPVSLYEGSYPFHLTAEEAAALHEVRGGLRAMDARLAKEGIPWPS